ncbi:MAG TPA: AAA family ATPase [Mollicutes bacterium]|nr:AAA family ATPase [Mollicutes bacterium]
MNLNNQKQIINYFLENNPIIKGSAKRPYIILFDGISGTGKSTIARIISEKLDVVVLNNDKVRQFLSRTNYIKKSRYPLLASQKLVKKIQYYRIKESIKNNNICVLDGNVINGFEDYIKFFKRNNIKYYIVKIKYNRRKVIKRLYKRKFDPKTFFINGSETINYSEANIMSFIYMEKNKRELPSEEIYFRIDTSKSYRDIEKKVLELINKIESE